jgi:hypothetical protein
MSELDRIARLESQYRRVRAATVVLGVLFAATLTTLHPRAQQSSDVLRVRGIIVEDADGRARVVLGAPMAEGQNSRTGLKLLDATGRERVGIALQPNGDAVIGLDAPRGTGDERNPERISLNATADGGAHVRFLDRRTSVVSRWYLDAENRVWLSFTDFSQKPAAVRRYGLSGEEVVKISP